LIATAAAAFIAAVTAATLGLAGEERLEIAPFDDGDVFDAKLQRAAGGSDVEICVIADFFLPADGDHIDLAAVSHGEPDRLIERGLTALDLGALMLERHVLTTRESEHPCHNATDE
jgi:hypothetical protein